MSAATAIDSRRATPWLVVGLAIGAGVVGAFQVGKAAMALPALRAELGVGLAAAGWVLAIFNLIGVATGMAIGGLVGRWGDRRAVLAGLALVAAASLAGAAAPDIAVLLATRFVEGMGFLMVIVGAPSLIMRLTRPQDMRLALGAWGAYMPLGQATMVLAAPLLLVPFGWRGLWIANSVLIALFAVLLARVTASLPSAPTRPARSLFKDLADTVRAPGPPLLAAIFGAYSMQYLAVMGFLPTVLIEQAGLGTAAAGALAALAMAMNGVGNVAAGFLLQRGARRWRLMATASLVMGSASLGIFAVPLPLAATYALYLAFAGFGGMLPASVFAAVPSHAPSRHLVPTTNGLLVQGSNLGQVVGPPAVGALAAAIGWQWAPLLIVPAAATASLLSLVLRRRGE
jgi:MFS transporter, DHA1 family, inner membrane transport protein